MVNTRNIGNEAEELATDFLVKNKIKIIDRNYRTRFGEIDIVGKRDGKVIFFEVKAKNTSLYGYPYEMVTTAKKKKLISTAKSYLLEKGFNIEETDWSIDVVSVDYVAGTIKRIENAVCEA